MQYIPWIISGLSLLVAFLSFLRTGKKESRAEIIAENQQMAGVKEALLKANLKLDQVCTTTNETRSDIKSMNKEMQEVSGRVTIVERDLKTAFKYIEELRKKD